MECMSIWRSFGKPLHLEIATYYEWSTRILNSYLQYLVFRGLRIIFENCPYPLAMNGSPRTCKIFQNRHSHLQQVEFPGLVKFSKNFYNMILKSVSENFRHFFSKPLRAKFSARTCKIFRSQNSG